MVEWDGYFPVHQQYPNKGSSAQHPRMPGRSERQYKWRGCSVGWRIRMVPTDVVPQIPWLSLQPQKIHSTWRSWSVAPHHGNCRIWLSPSIAVKPGSNNRDVSVVSQGSHRAASSSDASWQTALSPNCHTPSPQRLCPNPGDTDADGALTTPVTQAATWTTKVMLPCWPCRHK